MKSTNGPPGNVARRQHLFVQVVKTRSCRRHQHALVVGRKSDSKIESKQRLVDESKDERTGRIAQQWVGQVACDQRLDAQERHRPGR